MKRYLLGAVLALMMTAPVASAQPAAGANGSDLIHKAEFFLENSRYDEALAMIEAELAKNPYLKSSPEGVKVLYMKAQCFIGIGKNKEAIGELMTATRVDPNFAAGYDLMANLFSQMRNARMAVDNFEKAYQVDADPDNKLRYKFEVIDLLFKFNKYRDAKRHIDEAKTLDAENQDLLYYEGAYLNIMDKYEEALPLLEKFMVDMPEAEGNEKYFYEMGYTYFMLGKYDKAGVMFKKCENFEGEFRNKIKLFSAEAYYQAASAYLEVYSIEEADQHLSIALKIKPEYPEALNLKKRLAGFNVNQRKLIDAQVEQLKVTKDPKALEKQYEQLANLYFQSGMYREAIGAIDEVLKTRLQDQKLSFMKAVCDYKLKITSQATEILERSLKNPAIQPIDRAKFHFTLGLIYKNTNDAAKAREAFSNSMTNALFGAASRMELNRMFKVMQQGGSISGDDTGGEEE